MYITHKIVFIVTIYSFSLYLHRILEHTFPQMLTGFGLLDTFDLMRNCDELRE